MQFDASCRARRLTQIARSDFRNHATNQRIAIRQSVINLIFRTALRESFQRLRITGTLNVYRKRAQRELDYAVLNWISRAIVAATATRVRRGSSQKKKKEKKQIRPSNESFIFASEAIVIHRDLSFVSRAIVIKFHHSIH